LKERQSELIVLKNSEKKHQFDLKKKSSEKGSSEGKLNEFYKNEIKLSKSDKKKIT
jgi:hypothetical protein